jgi:hypothetical protein
MVLAGRSAPLADLFRSESERLRGEHRRVEDDLEDSGHPLPDLPDAA